MSAFQMEKSSSASACPVRDLEQPAKMLMIYLKTNLRSNDGLLIHCLVKEQLGTVVSR